MDTPLILLCPGQGAQAVGMGKAWYDASPDARKVFDEADRALGNRLGAKLTELCLSGPADRLNRTDISQPAIYTASVASWKGMLAAWGHGNGEARIAAVAGLSLGEYTALHVAGVVFDGDLEVGVHGAGAAGAEDFDCVLDVAFDGDGPFTVGHGAEEGAD